MARRETKQQIIDRLNLKIDGLEANALRFSEILNEARRRTIPMNNGQADYNFLPLCITELDIQYDTKTYSSIDGRRHAFSSRATATIVCEGDVIAIPARPAEPIKSKPDHALGWKILNGYADRIADDNERGNYLADCRVFESGFTSGDISEIIYHAMLMTLFPKGKGTL